MSSPPISRYKPGDTMESKPLGQRFVIVELPTPENHFTLVADQHLSGPHAGFIAEHVHLNFAETFEVLEGNLVASVGRKEIVLEPGSKLPVPIGERHINPYTTDGGPAALRRTFTPEFDIIRFAEIQFALAEKGKIGPNGLPGMLHTALLSKQMRAKTVLAGVPAGFQLGLMGLMAPLGKLLGYKLD